MSDESFPASFIAERAVLLAVSGKLRGSRARRLGERLQELAAEGIQRAVLDLRTLTSIDSLGTFSLEEGIDCGLRIYLVVRPGFELDSFAAQALGARGVRVYLALDEALRTVRRVVDSGLLLV